MNNFNAVSDFYKHFHAQIMGAKKNEWGIDPYEWDTGMIQMTPIESWLWHDIRAVDVVLYPQYPVAGFFVDFANPRAKVAIECDGFEFHQDKAKDAARDKKLTNAGWTVYRITGKDCRDVVGLDSDSVARAFITRIANNHGINRPT